MAASSGDNITQSMNGGNPVVTTVASPRSIGGTSLSAVALTNWPTTTRVFFTTYKKTTAGLKDFTTVTSWWAIVSGTTLGTLTYVAGAADAGNADGDFIEMGPTAAWAEALYQFGIAEHSSGGVHDPTKVAMLAGTQTFTGSKTFSAATTLANNDIQANELATNAITLGYAQITGTFTTSATSAAQVTGLTATVTIPAGGRKVKITAMGKDVFTSTGASAVTLSIWDGTVGSGTQLAASGATLTAAGTAGFVEAIAVVTPAAGSKTYNVALSTSNGSNAANLEAAATAPAFILIETI